MSVSAVIGYFSFLSSVMAMFLCDALAIFLYSFYAIGANFTRSLRHLHDLYVYGGLVRCKV